MCIAIIGTCSSIVFLIAGIDPSSGTTTAISTVVVSKYELDRESYSKHKSPVRKVLQLSMPLQLRPVAVGFSPLELEPLAADVVLLPLTTAAVDEALPLMTAAQFFHHLLTCF